MKSEIFKFKTCTVDAKGSIISEATKQITRITITLPFDVPLFLVEIPSGCCIMGSPASERGFEINETPRHPIKAEIFYLGQFPITKIQWQAIAESAQLSLLPSEKIMGNKKNDCRQHPATNMTWHEANLFCDYLSKYTQQSFRLPTEKEWEYAARSKTISPFCYGQTLTPKLANYDWRSAYSLETTELSHICKSLAVGNFPPNEFGLYDIHGQVWEYCQDSWSPKYNCLSTNAHEFFSVENTEQNPHIVRGGSFNYAPVSCRSASRFFIPYEKKYPDLGFRVAMDCPF